VCPPALRQQVEGPSAQLEPGQPAQLREPTRYAQAALAGELANVRAAQAPQTVYGKARPGNRNDTLNRAAYVLGQLVGAGLLDRRTVQRDLAEAARDVGLGPVEAARTIHSGLTAGALNPRQALPATTEQEATTAARSAETRARTVPARQHRAAPRVNSTAQIPRQTPERG
jgi:hypothetical protein